jgi:glutathione synthase/RimK-type ligase-like ATP-grasp enzyme
MIIKILKKIKNKFFGDPWAHLKDQSQYKELFDKYAVKFDLSNYPKRKIGFICEKHLMEYDFFQNACKEFDLPFIYIDPFSPTFIQDIKEADCDGYIVRIWHENKVLRDLYDEKMSVMTDDLKLKVWPNKTESRIYEGKRRLAYFLEANNIPHPKTRVFYDQISAINFLKETNYPILFKSHIGASASGVKLVKNFAEGKKLVKKLLNGKFKRKHSDNRDFEWGYVLFQDYIKDVREYRVIKLGDSWFGHEKTKTSNQTFHSGSGHSEWTPPSEKLLDFCNEIVNRHEINCSCFDIFETLNGEFLVNEIQTWFGSYNPSQMYVNGVPGRYIKKEGEWIFETGLYNVNGGANIRLAEFIKFINR